MSLLLLLFPWDIEQNSALHDYLPAHVRESTGISPVIGVIKTRNTNKFYRRAMKAKAEVATAQISNDLHEQLPTKDAVSFWETWKNKIN